MHRFFVSPEQIEEDSITITGEDYKHLTKVLRVSDHEPFEVCDGQGTDYICTISERRDDSVRAQVTARHPSVGENPYSLTLFQGLPKGQKLEEIVQKGTECGVNRFVPFESAFCVAKIKGEKQAQKKRERLARVAYEAAKQSKRGHVPTVGRVIPFAEMARSLSEYNLALFAYEHEDGTTLKGALSARDLTRVKNIAVIVGPEGGFSEEEVGTLCSHGAVSVSLGKRILRTQTAGVVLAAQINYAFE